jgi:thiosulfate/3-mercaptopyruvate sulfurtransferase
MLVAIAAVLTIGRLQTEHAGAVSDSAWLADVETGADHLSPQELMGELMAAPPDLLLVDLRPADEYAVWHLPGALNLTVPEVCGDTGARLLAAPPRLIVLYSEGPAHPGQAWTELRRRGHTNVRSLAGGLEEFREQVLMPPSLRRGATEYESRAEAPRFELQRAFLQGSVQPSPLATWATDPEQLREPTLVSTKWLHKHLGEVAILDVRPAAEYSPLHVPGAQHLPLGKLRSKTGNTELFFVPDAQLAQHFGELGLTRSTPIVICSDSRFHDATMAAVALLRLGHRALAILEGGVLRWAAERRPLVATIPAVQPAAYQPQPGADDFSIAIDDVAAAVKEGATAVLDVRPPEFFRGDKSTEARPGHIPGAINRVYSHDVQRTEDGQWLRPRADLAKEYTELGLRSDGPVVVHCRTGHQASQTYFVMRHLLGYEKVRWFNGSWTEWAERKDLPATTGDK